jgi:NADP-dependent 3-hydroxy acid dehydrogenase YdfG
MTSEKNPPEVVVITGASAGVGRATAQVFARAGAHIGLLARGADGLEATRRDVEAAGGKGLIQSVDVARPEEVEAAAQAIEETFGLIDIWINNAMATIFAPFHAISAEEFRRATEVTYLGTVYGTMAALRRMRLRDRGMIVQVGSALAYRSIPLQSAYCGAKHAIRGFTDSLRSELIHDRSRVRLTMVQLPGLNTPQFDWARNRMPQKAQPIPPIYQPEVAAEAIYWAAHHDRRELFVGLSSVKAILGNKLAPGILDKYLATAAVTGQQTGEPADPTRADNLTAPLPGDHGAHGRFDDRARTHSPQLWATAHRPWLAAATAGLAGLALVLIWGRGR